MTTTNQAFIKAYREDSAQNAAAGPVGAERQSAPVGEVAATAAPSSARSAIYGPRPAGVGAQHRPAPRHDGANASQKRPLSSFIARAVHKTPVDSNEPEILKPGTTIASFQWPLVCRALAQQCGPQLDVVAQRLLTNAQAGRSLIGVLGLFPGRGATTTAMCLAARLASRDRRLILVDGNFRNPRLACSLDATPTTGWQDVLKHRGNLADAVIRANDDCCDLLALDGKIPTNAQQLVGGLQAIVTAGVIRHSYDLAIFDLGAFFDSASQATVLELLRNMSLDAVLAVTGPAPADPRDLDFLTAQLRRSGCEPLGLIENRVPNSQAA